MARYDLFRNPDGPGYLIALQSDLLDVLNTVVVAPLWPKTQAPNPATRLNPVFDIHDEPHVMLTQFMAAVPSTVLAEPIGSLADEADVITNAIDMLFFGF